MRLVPKSEIRYSTVRPRVRTMDGCINRTGTCRFNSGHDGGTNLPLFIYWCPEPGSITSPGAKLDARQCARRVRAMDGPHQPHGHRAGSTQVTMGARISRFLLIGARGRGRQLRRERSWTHDSAPAGCGPWMAASTARAPCRFNSGHDGGTNAHLNYWCPGPGSTTSPGAKLDARQCARRVRAMDGPHQPHGHRAGSTQVTMGAQTPTSIIGARGRGRTGTVSPPRDFHTRYSFHCCVAVQTHLGSGLSLYPILCSGRRQEPSSLYTFPMR